MSPVSYRLELPPELSRIHPVFHVSQLKLHQGPIPRTRAHIVVSADDDVEYEVDRIISMRLGRGSVPEYLVLWKGYGAHDATWEPAKNL